MHFKWNYEPPTSERQTAAKELGEKIGMSPILADLLIQRGIKTESAAKRFFRPMLSELIDPFLMNDMDVAVDRLNDAMGRKERIMVYGDYDVDGCTAVALVYKFLQQFYSNIEYYIPDRYEEGYGISRKGIDYAKEAGVKLVIVLDCGIKAITCRMMSCLRLWPFSIPSAQTPPIHSRISVAVAWASSSCRHLPRTTVFPSQD